jgi:hypothetical protein
MTQTGTPPQGRVMLDGMICDKWDRGFGQCVACGATAHMHSCTVLPCLHRVYTVCPLSRFSTGIYWCKRAAGGYFPAQTVTFTGNPLTGGAQLIIQMYNYTTVVPATAFQKPTPCNQSVAVA